LAWSQPVFFLLGPHPLQIVHDAHPHPGPLCRLLVVAGYSSAMIVAALFGVDAAVIASTARQCLDG
jgi:hypothetical protein